MKCEKSFTITVAPAGCVDWTTIAWGAASTFNGTFFPNPGTGDTFDAVTLGGVGQAINTAPFTYKGPGCNCQCNVLITGDPLPNNGTCKISVYQVAPFVPLVCFAAAGAAPGGYLVTWSMPDTLGVTINYEVHVSFTSIIGSAVTTLHGVLSNP